MKRSAIATTEVLHFPASQAMAEVGRSVLIANMIQAVTEDVCIYASWGVHYGICHAMVMTASNDTEKQYWKELRTYFMKKYRKFPEDMMV